MSKEVPPVGAVVIYSNEDEGRTARMIVVHVSNYDNEPLLYLASKPISPPDGDEAKLFHPINLVYHMMAGWWAGGVDVSGVVDTGERVKVIPFKKTDDYKRWAGCTFDGQFWQLPNGLTQ